MPSSLCRSQVLHKRDDSCINRAAYCPASFKHPCYAQLSHFKARGFSPLSVRSYLLLRQEDKGRERWVWQGESLEVGTKWGCRICVRTVTWVLPEGCLQYRAVGCFSSKEESWAAGTAKTCLVRRLYAKYTWWDAVKCTHKVCVQATHEIAAWSEGKWTVSLCAYSCSCAPIKFTCPSNAMHYRQSNVSCLSLKYNPKIHSQWLPLTWNLKVHQEYPGLCVSKPAALAEALLEPWSCCGAGRKSPQHPQPTSVPGKYPMYKTRISLQTMHGCRSLFLIEWVKETVWISHVVLV